jgi:hypothetical protein
MLKNIFALKKTLAYSDFSYCVNTDLLTNFKLVPQKFL